VLAALAKSTKQCGLSDICASHMSNPTKRVYDQQVVSVLGPLFSAGAGGQYSRGACTRIACQAVHRGGPKQYNCEAKAVQLRKGYAVQRELGRTNSAGAPRQPKVRKIIPYNKASMMQYNTAEPKVRQQCGKAVQYRTACFRTCFLP
jgi:hypothetical protein